MSDAHSALSIFLGTFKVICLYFLTALVITGTAFISILPVNKLYLTDVGQLAYD